MSQCCQLHVHSSHSFFDGLAPVEQLVQRARELGQPGIALTDHGHVFAAAQFFKACAGDESQRSLKGLIGMEAYEAVPHEFNPKDPTHIAPFKEKWREGLDRYFHLTLWCMNATGWRTLCLLHTLSWQPHHKPKNQPLVDRAMLEAHHEGLAVGLGCIQSRTSRAIAKHEDAYQAAKWYKDVFGDLCFMEVMANLPEQQALLREQRKLAGQLGIECVATNDVHYRDREDGQEYGPHHVLVQARRWKRKQEDEGSSDKSDAAYGRWYGSDEFYLKSYEEMCATGGLLEPEVARTVDVLERSSFDFAALPPPSPPVAPIPAYGEDLEFEAWLQSRS